MKERCCLNLFIHPEIQLRLLALILLAGLLGAIIFGALVYRQNQIIHRLAEDGEATKVSAQLWTLGIVSGIVYCLGLALLLFFGLLVSHRIIGPFKRLKRELDYMYEVQKVKLCVVRDYDYLVPFFEKLNRVLINTGWEE